ncbi:MAG: Rieske 2Fe-2S domain-containing protein [Burkholderiales bacterium]
MSETKQSQTAAAQAKKMVEGYSVEHTGPGTPAGRYLRRFWQPVYHSVDLKPGRPVPLKIMSEEFTLYRADDGVTHLTEARCPHRGTRLSSAWIEGDALRCFYHGWKFAADGQCVEQPAEESSFAQRIALKTWPTREYLGLVFAYLGEGAPPAFPLYPPFERFSGLVEVDSYLRECNYYQNLENALDMSHVGFVHADNTASFNGIGLGRNLTAVESDWGVTYAFQRADGRRRIQQFGMPNVFYMTALPTEADIGWQESLFWWVPIDDERHMQFSLHRVPIEGEAAKQFKERREKKRSTIDLAHQEICREILGGMMSLRDVDRNRVDLVRLQDDIAQVGQGTFASRNPERLGRADVGLAMIRRLVRREIGNLVEGRALKAWQRSSAIVPHVWALEDDGVKALATTEDLAEAEIIDIRPHVEVKMQLKGLHGVLSGRE